MATRAIVAVATVTALSALVVLPTSAAQASPFTSEKHCAVNLDTGSTACAADARSAVTAVTAFAAASYTLARVYDGTGYTGASLTYAHSRPCTSTYGDTDYYDPSFDDAFWNNRISSVRTYNSCDLKLYDGTNFSGASSTWIDASSNLGSIGTGWSNRASSLKFS